MGNGKHVSRQQVFNEDLIITVYPYVISSHPQKEPCKAAVLFGIWQHEKWGAEIKSFAQVLAVE